MDYLFSPWRYSYVTAPRNGDGCVFCELGGSDPADDEQRYVVYRATHHYVVLNAYPYTSGHLMIVPYEHASRLSALRPAALHELVALTAQVEAVLDEAYHPDGINVGLNLGKCAGAGIEEHLHLHAVPRWFGDTSFMTVVGETRVLPEVLRESWRRLSGRFSGRQ
jgi:ATP adenylyltransferase